MTDKLKEILERPHNIQREILRLGRTLDELAAEALPSGVSYNGVTVKGSGYNHDSVQERYIVKADAIAQEIRRLQWEFLDAHDNLVGLLEALPDNLHDVLFLYYIGGQSWRGIGFELGMTDGGVYKRRRQAIDQLEEIIKGRCKTAI